MVNVGTTTTSSDGFLLQPWAIAAFVIYSSLCLLALGGQVAAALLGRGEVGYGDASVLWDVFTFAHSGFIYRSPGTPPYLPPLYGPLTYAFLAVGTFWGSTASSPTGVRLVVLGASVACVATCGSIAKQLVRQPKTGLFSMLLAASTSVYAQWCCQLRGDYFATFFDLLAVRLLLSGRGPFIALAGACSGLAFTFKSTHVAIAVGGVFWLFATRSRRDSVVFSTAGALTAGGVYALFFAREPWMLQNLSAMDRPLFEYRVWLWLLLTCLKEPVVVVGVLFTSLHLRHAEPNSWLLAICAACALAVGAAASVQAGANVNYYIEATFLSAPMTTALAMGVARRPARPVQLVVQAAVAISLICAMPALVGRLATALARLLPGNQSVWDSNVRSEEIEAALAGQHLFSTVPAIALFDARPALLDPFLAHYLEIQGKFDPAPLLLRITSQNFDVVVTPLVPARWRSIEHESPSMRNSVRKSYIPYCEYEGKLLWLPRMRGPSRTLMRRLQLIGCQPRPWMHGFEAPH